MRNRRRAGRYDTMMCGADSSTASVAMIVNRVKIIRHSLSTTMAANFQSRETSASSSSLRIWKYIFDEELAKNYRKQRSLKGIVSERRKFEDRRLYITLKLSLQLEELT